MPSFSLEGLEVADCSPSLSIFSPRPTSSFTNVALVTDARGNESQLHPRRHSRDSVTHFMCFTALDPTLSATNSTVLRSDGGWLWKKACSRSTWHHTQQSQHGGSTLATAAAAADSPAVSAGTGWEWTRPWAQRRWG